MNCRESLVKHLASVDQAAVTQTEREHSGWYSGGGGRLRSSRRERTSMQSNKTLRWRSIDATPVDTRSFVFTR